MDLAPGLPEAHAAVQIAEVGYFDYDTVEIRILLQVNTLAMWKKVEWN